jgi:hypothetical protein
MINELACDKLKLEEELTYVLNDSIEPRIKIEKSKDILNKLSINEVTMNMFKNMFTEKEKKVL